jgi:hypothetical protein
MTWKRYAMTPFVLVLCSVAQAQQHRGQPAHNAGAPHHPGGAQPGHPQMRPAMSPEEHMWNQWHHEQMMMNQMMGGPRGRRSQQQGSSGRSMPSQPGQNRPTQAQAGRAGSPNHEGGKNDANHSPAAKKTEHKPTHATQKSQPRNPKNASQRHVMSDPGIISLLRTSHTQLEKADHDYAGHRVNAMRHIASAVQDLGSTTPLNSISLVSTGSLAQAQSNGILRDALVHLRYTESSLATGTNRTEHHHQARTAVAHAIRELETALRVR